MILASQIQSRTDAIIFVIVIPVTMLILIVIGRIVRTTNHPEASNEPVVRFKIGKAKHGTSSSQAAPWRGSWTFAALLGFATLILVGIVFLFSR